MLVNEVSPEYKELMKKEINNREHKYFIRNTTRNLNLTELLVNESLTINRFLRTATGNISPNNVQLNLIATTYDRSDMFLKDFHHAYSEYKGWTWKQLLNLENLEEYLCKIGDQIQIIDSFNNEELVIFTGNVSNVTRVDSFNGREVKVVVDDNTIKGYTYNFSEDIQFQNMYLYKSTDKEYSLLYILCKDYLEISEDKIDIEEIKLPNGEYIKIPLAKFQKNTSVMSEIGEIIRSIYGNIYSMPDGSIKINSWFNKDYINKLDLTIGNKENNFPVLSFIESTDIKPKNNKVEVKYTNTIIEEKRVVFSLGGHNATVDNANIVVPKNTLNSEQWWQIDFRNIIDLEETPIVKSYQMIGNERNYISYTNFELEKINSNIYKVRFNNNTNKDIFIEKFEFKGKPIVEYKDNEVSYAEDTTLTNKNTSLKVVSYKYIQSKEQARAIAKHTFYNECRDYTTVKLRTNNCPFLKLEDVINLDFKKYKDTYQIIAITQTNEYTELVLKLYREYQGINNFTYSEKSNNLVGKQDIGTVKNIVEENVKKVNTANIEIESIKEQLPNIVINTSEITKNRENISSANEKIGTNTIKIENLVTNMEDSKEELKNLIFIAQNFYREWQELDISDFKNGRFPENCKEIMVDIIITNPKDNKWYNEDIGSKVIIPLVLSRQKLEFLENDMSIMIGNYETSKGYTDEFIITKKENKYGIYHISQKNYNFNYKVYWR